MQDSPPPLQTPPTTQRSIVDFSMAKDAGKDLDKVADDAGSGMVMKGDAAASSASIGEAIKAHNASLQARFEAVATQEAALKAVKIEAADVATLVTEFELPKPLAERALRQAGGNVKAAAYALVFGAAA